MPLNTLKDLLVRQLRELQAAELHSADLLPRLAKAASNPALSDALHRHAAETKEHITRLHNVLQALNTPAPPALRDETRGMKGLCEDCLALAQMPEASPNVRDAAILAAAQHVEHDEIAGYGCARSWAHVLGNEGAAKVLQKTLEEERASDAVLTRLADRINKVANEPSLV